MLIGFSNQGFIQEGVNSLTKFERVGVGFQYNAENKYQAIKSFQYSCTVCCQRGIRLDCDRCAIAHTHEATLAAFDTLKKARKSKCPTGAHK